MADPKRAGVAALLAFTLMGSLGTWWWSSSSSGPDPKPRVYHSVENSVFTPVGCPTPGPLARYLLSAYKAGGQDKLSKTIEGIHPPFHFVAGWILQRSEYTKREIGRFLLGLGHTPNLRLAVANTRTSSMVTGYTC